MKKILITLLLIICLTLVGCNSNKYINDSASSENTIISDLEDKTLKLYIDDIEINVTWENNASVNALKELETITVNMHQYGGFEQVGSIGKTITSNDKQITTNPGDIVLYSSNQIVIFFGSNTWSYTKLGHLNLNQDELNNILDKSNVILRIE
ncbi:MAG: hypothetical protein K6E20_00385 [Acholeplasmatales bacterium]|nr:hypothetical protein [Acholeplasmatales bacterium]